MKIGRSRRSDGRIPPDNLSQLVRWSGDMLYDALERASAQRQTAVRERQGACLLADDAGHFFDPREFLGLQEDVSLASEGTDGSELAKAVLIHPSQ
jgi:hypothetical protein